MKKSRKRAVYMGLMGILGMLCSCKLVRQDLSVKGLPEEFTGLIHPGKYVYTKGATDVDIGGATELFMDLSEEEAWEYHCVFWDEEMPYFETEEYFLAINCTEAVSILQFELNYEKAYDSYEGGVFGEYMAHHSSSSQLRLAFPDEDITSYTKEDALEFCRPYAEYLGYEDTNVEVYAVTLDILQETSIFGDNMRISSAPYPGYVKNLVTKEEWEAANESGDEDEIWQLQSRYAREISELPIVEWQEKDEAFIVVYQTEYEGIPVEGNNGLNELIIIYAPQYDKPVLVQAVYEQEEAASLQADLPITSDDAVSKLLLYKSLESMDDIEIKKIEPVYGCSTVQEKTLGAVRVMTPYWKVEYQLKSRNGQTIGADSGVVWVNAVYGEVSQ